MKTITLKNYQQDIRTCVDNAPHQYPLVTIIQLARHIGASLFGEHKCYEYEATESGIIGKQKDGTAILLERSALEKNVLSCLTELVMRSAASEANGLIGKHNDQVMREGREEQMRKREEMIAKLTQDEHEAATRLAQQGVLVAEIRQQLQDTSRAVDEAKRTVEYLKGRGELHTDLLAAPVDYEAEKKAAINQLKELQEQHRQLEKKHANATTEHGAAHSAYEKAKKARQEYLPSTDPWRI